MVLNFHRSRQLASTTKRPRTEAVAFVKALFRYWVGAMMRDLGAYERMSRCDVDIVDTAPGVSLPDEEGLQSDDVLVRLKSIHPTCRLCTCRAASLLRTVQLFCCLMHCSDHPPIVFVC